MLNKTKISYFHDKLAPYETDSRLFASDISANFKVT